MPQLETIRVLPEVDVLSNLCPLFQVEIDLGLEIGDSEAELFASEISDSNVRAL